MKIKLLFITASLLFSTGSFAQSAIELTDQGFKSAEAGDYNTARQLWEKAAEQGNEQAQFNLGLLYQDGIGVQQDLQKAIYWFEKAAAQNHVEAQFNLGLLYQEGYGVKKDYKKAKYWYEKAAAQGDKEAEHNLKVLQEMMSS